MHQDQHEPVGPTGCTCGCGCGAPDRTHRTTRTDSREVLGALGMLTQAVAATGGWCAALTQLGRYGPGSTTHGALDVRSGRIDLRLDAASITAATIGEGSGEGDAVVHLIDAQQRSAHRLRVGPGEDRLVLEGLLRADGHGGAELPWSTGATTGAAGGPDAGAPDLRTEAGWHDGDHLAQLDALVTDGGLARRAELAASGAVRYRQLPPAMLPDFLEHVSLHALGVGVAALAPGAMQAVQGPVQTVHRQGSRLRAVVDRAILDLDCSRVGECLLTQSSGVHGTTSTVEVYADTGRCELAVTQLGLVPVADHAHWEHLAEVLPAGW